MQVESKAEVVFPTAEQDLISCPLHAGQGLLRRDFLAGCSPRIGAGWQQKLLGLDISVSGKFLLEVLVSNLDMHRIGSRGRWLG